VTKVATWKKSYAIDYILEFLAKDGAWHSISEIAAATQLSQSDTVRILDFLATQNFVQLDKHGRRAKIEERTAEFLKRVSEEEHQISELDALHSDSFSTHCNI
jgi:DNA-binding IclR family transcriptional regulator